MPRINVHLIGYRVAGYANIPQIASVGSDGRGPLVLENQRNSVGSHGTTRRIRKARRKASSRDFRRCPRGGCLVIQVLAEAE